MMFVHAHHQSEDIGLYPVVRARRPDAAALLDAMHDEHEAIAIAMADVDAAAAEYGMSDGRAPVISAIEQLQAVLLPHLRHEEEDLMPMVADTMTAGEWHQIEYEHNLKGKSKAQLGREGHWLIDDASRDDRQTVLGLVPPVPRLIVLHGYGRSYRRLKGRCWNLSSKRRVQKDGHAETVVDAPVGVVWDVVRDVGRVGEWSHECVGITWLGDHASAVPGARFRGRNHQGLFRWGRVCEIVAAGPHELVWRTVPTALYPDSTVWTIRLHELERGTRIEQTFQVVRAPKLLDIIYARMVPAHVDRTAALTEDLQRLGQLALAKPATAV